MKKNKPNQKILWNTTNLIYAFAGVFLVVFLILLTLSLNGGKGLTIWDFLLLIVFAVVALKLKLVRSNFRHFVEGSIEWKKPGLFILLFIIACALAITFDVLFR